MLVEKNFTVRALSREYLLKTFSKQIADEVFPQDKERVISKETLEITTTIQKIVLEEISKNGYVVINEVKEKVQRIANKSASWTDYKYKQAEAEMLDAYGLKKISLTNDLRAELNITHLEPTARPRILIYA